MNLPQKIGRREKSERATTSITKREEYLELHNDEDTPPIPCYHGLADFKKRVGKLKLGTYWEMIENETYVEMQYIDSNYILPKFQIFVSEDLSYKMRCFGWLLPSQNRVYDACQSFKEITFSNFVLMLDGFNLCEGKFFTS